MNVDVNVHDNGDATLLADGDNDGDGTVLENGDETVNDDGN